MKRAISMLLILIMLGCAAYSESEDTSYINSAEVYLLQSPFQPSLFEGHTYNIFPASSMSWEEMKSKCETMNGYLACINSREEDEFLSNLVMTNNLTTVYFGLFCDETDQWFWIDNSPTDYLPWRSGEPNGCWGIEPYGCYYYPYGEYTDEDKIKGNWNDGSGNGDYFLCEWDSDLLESLSKMEEELQSNYPTMEKGSKGDEVKVLQQRLVDLLWLNGSVDGDFGNKTKAAVESFQQAAGLPKTGIADGLTQALLFSDEAPEYELHIEWTGTSSVSQIINGRGFEMTYCYWNVDGQEYVLENGQTKTVNTPAGTYKLYPTGEYKKIG